MMKFCKNCGKEFVQGAKFCKHCGEDLTATTESQSLGLDTTQKPSPEPPKDSGLSTSENRQTVKSKLSIAITGVLIVLLLIGYQVGASMTSQEKIIERFETAMIEKDAGTVADILKSSSKNLTINEEAVSGFINYFSENPSKRGHLINHLKRQGQDYENNSNVADAADDSPFYYAVNLVKDGKKLIFDNYEINVSPVYFTVYTNYENTEILLDEEVIAISDKENFSKEVGPYLPGTYQFRANYKSDFIELTTETERTNFDPGYTDEVDLYVEGEHVEFYIPFDEQLTSTTLSLNSEDTGIDVTEQHTVGPVLTDGSMSASIEGEFPWGSIKTEEVPIDNNYIDVEFSADEALKQTIQDKVIQFNQEYIEAYTSADASLLTVAGEQIIDALIDDIEYDQNYGNFYQGKFIGIDFYSDSFTINHNGDSWYIAVDTNTLYEEGYYNDFDNEVELEETTEERGYELTYNEETQQWLVTYVGWAGYMESNKMMEHRELEPKMFKSSWAE
ncbi:zinc ribbon domain-containing protein [Virgibacillus byunsanensis]|uniref:Zinc ribbon domain-containing protein n=1 Tax=Virgibacillus byunsanensis TaxID=570945 RepID=A0ABW3LGU5_9BACI